MALLGGSLATRLTPTTGQPLKPVIGFLAIPARVPRAEPYFAAFEKALAEGGFPPGHAVTVEYRNANNRADQLRSLAQELVDAGASIIVTPSGSPAI